MSQVVRTYGQDSMSYLVHKRKMNRQELLRPDIFDHRVF